MSEKKFHFLFPFEYIMGKTNRWLFFYIQDISIDIKEIITKKEKKYRPSFEINTKAIDLTLDL